MLPFPPVIAWTLGAVGVLLVTTELDELVSLCDRVLIMFRGAIVGELSGEAIERRAILQASMTGQIQAAA